MCMSSERFNCKVKGLSDDNRGEGNGNSGLKTHLKTRNSGVKVVAKHVKGYNVFEVYVTDGDAKTKKDRRIKTIRVKEAK